MKTLNRKAWMVIALTLCLILVSSSTLPVSAQDTTEQPPQTQPIPSAEPSEFLSLTLGEALAILIGTGALFVGIGKILWDANQNPDGRSLDTRLSERVSAVSDDRAYMDGLEKGYQAGTAALHKALESTVKVLEIIAPQTGFKVDDAVLKVLKDIREPGAALIPANEPTVFAQAAMKDDAAG